MKWKLFRAELKGFISEYHTVDVWNFAEGSIKENIWCNDELKASVDENKTNIRK